MAVTLDCAPIIDGYTADIGYSTRFGENPIFDRLFADLAEFRPFILDRVRAGQPLREVWNDVDALHRGDGLRQLPQHLPRPRARPHRDPGRPPASRASRWRWPSGCGPSDPRPRGGHRAAKGRSPLWGPAASSDHPPQPGLWAVEPHLGFRGYGREVRGDPGRHRQTERLLAGRRSAARAALGGGAGGDGMMRRAPGHRQHGGVELCVAELGDPDAPTVVLVHGYPDTKEVWSEVAERLAGPLPCGPVRRAGAGAVRAADAAARRVHAGAADGRLPRRRRRGQPGPAGAPGRPRLGLGAGLGVRHGQAHRGPDRLLHLDVGPVPGPLRALDQEADGAPDPPQGRPAPRPGRQVLVRVPAAHARAARARLARPASASAGRRSWSAWRRCPAADYPTPSLPTDAAHGAWLYRDNVRARLRRPRADAYAHAPVQLITPAGDIFLPSGSTTNWSCGPPA